MTDTTKRVARGVKWLDRHAPGWEERVKLREFDIESECRCVLGQVFAETYWGYPSILKDYNTKGIITRRHATACGFDVSATLHDDKDLDAAFSDLQHEWERVIRERKGALPSPKASTSQKEATVRP